MKKHLGRGLEALISEFSNSNISSQSTPEGIIFIEIDKLQPPKWQPRRNFKDETLKQLAESIKQSGIIEPIIVSPIEENKYEIICGERRWRAAKIANIKEIPAIVKNLDEKQRKIISLIENIQREDLNPIEEAYAYKSLIEEYNLTQEELSRILSKDRSVIANTLRILNLPQEVINYIQDSLISAGHARALASIKDENTIIELANKIIQDKLTVRDIENIVKSLKSKKVKKQKDIFITAEIKHFEKEISETLGLKTKIRPSSNTKGKIIIYYKSLDEFDKIIKILKK
ncbi:MAG: ParB/RepB/Spo0J family partition protein [Endomicrobia bacterium]|nr:ParB/RepB/Spo0J family partition protein [Endomicrobiia bacterium]